MAELKTYNSIDKTAWGPGPWQGEPDHCEWVDKATGYISVINRPDHHGALCGYVVIPEGHPYYGKGYDDLPFDVHGGITYSSSLPECLCLTSARQGWVVGFDTGHFSDYMPAIEALLDRPYCTVTDLIYRDFDYVKREVTNLASQIKEMEMPL